MTRCQIALKALEHTSDRTDDIFSVEKAAR